MVSEVRAILGPTNTGKTHRAIERMLEHRSGMIGLPLRLLAREVYDKVVARRGADQVALITGEEKRVPADPRYFVCTVEAMPVDRPVAFLAVDEIQLAGDRNRGHTFTDRLLNARGVTETLFLGADTVAGLLERLIPRIRIDGAPRLSKLTYAGVRKLSSVPPRSAVVAFSADAVYEAAERLRAVHGGAAVVLGALSPRTRNAQVALYQSGEVKHLVATDAIGMGLNMDVQHVAFAAVRKFDGRGHRDLSSAELAQIAGRAGRYKADGTFGTTRAVPAGLPEEVVAAIEGHAFPPLTRLFWRNSDLDLRSAERLLTSLRRPPPVDCLVPAWSEDDQRTHEALSEREDLRPLLTGRDEVGRLWQVCQVPDYHQTRTDAHAELLGQIAGHLLRAGALPDDFVERHVQRLDRTDGDIETLMSRIAWIRTWTYVAWQRDWTRRPAHFQAWTRDVEDRLSDALHERLTARFVDRRVLVALDPNERVTVGDEGEVRVGGHDVGRVANWSFVATGGQTVSSRSADAAVRRRLREQVRAQVDSLVDGPDAALSLDEDGRLVVDGVALGRLTAGVSVLEPKVVLGRLDLLEAGDRERVRVRLQQWVQRTVDRLFAPLDRPAAQELTAPARGLVYAVRMGLGSVDRAEVEALLRGLGPQDRAELAKLDVRLGMQAVYVQSLLRPEPMAVRGALWSVAAGVQPRVRPPPDGRAAAPPEGIPEGALRAMGFRVVGGVAVRVDLLEKVGAEVRAMARSREPRGVERLTSWLGAPRERVLAVARELGFRVRAREDGTVRSGAGA
ncbi:MAG: helicase-related protein [Myxococcota bacterium]